MFHYFYILNPVRGVSHYLVYRQIYDTFPDHSTVWHLPSRHPGARVSKSENKSWVIERKRVLPSRSAPITS